MPRAAVLSVHARVSDVESDAWRHPAYVQLWGPRFNAYVVAGQDLPVFTLGRAPEDARGQARAEDIAQRLHAFLDGRSMGFGLAARGMGVPANLLRYATTTGTVALHWDGARQPLVRSLPAPLMQVAQARLELLRRYLHVFGPATEASFAKWAGIAPKPAHAAFQALAAEIIAVRTPIGEAWMLAEDEAAMRDAGEAAAPARLLPSGDTYYLAWGEERALLLPSPDRRARLWTTRVWPGALLLDGEIAGIWRRQGGIVTIETWQRLSSAHKAAVEAEAASLPLPDCDGPIATRWN